ncbi:hypothetical protein [Heyndrickxia coagulans]|uniref:Uncharacterized protein n=1 Tax=Heyndrickxia coagulans TaxID=1398 RepID=A0AAW7CKE6_HEYCO|nr:hypothetical protein [Heyndrickxia coagulans]MDL5041486.1 hypothetical protein [Heyndrickxia coagulans]
MKKLDALSLLSTYMLGNIAKNVHFPNLEGSFVRKRRKKSFASTGRGVQQYRKKVCFMIPREKAHIKSGHVLKNAA